MDYSRHLVLYSGGADSTYFIETEPTAKHLIHFETQNQELKKLATINANLLHRHISFVNSQQFSVGSLDGETNQIHALNDTAMILHASIIALNYGMTGVVACFNKDDIAVDIESLNNIVKRVNPEFSIVFPLHTISAEYIRSKFTEKAVSLRYISCMHSENCGYCAKCRRKY